ncbi:MAG: exo-alpha-sialidase [Acidobacteriaceae bacterium]|nr:exo-alpha-sialidase [Acidobacteriaceae bacterium]
MKLSIALGTICAVGLATVMVTMATASRWYPKLEAARLHRAAESHNARDLNFWNADVNNLRCTSELRTEIGETVEIASSFGYCWFPTIHRFRSGALLTTVRISPDDRNPAGECSAYTISKDGGRSWTRLYSLGAGGNVDAAYTQSPEEELWVLGSGYDSADPVPGTGSRQFVTSLSRFSAEGMHFEQQRSLLQLTRPAKTESAKVTGRTREDTRLLGRELPMVNPWGEIIQAKNGCWLSTLYYNLTSDARSTRLVLMRSTDQGITWKEISVIAAVEEGSASSWTGDEGPNEAGMVRLANGSLFVVFRTGQYLGYTRSLDDGLSWTKPQPTPFKGVAPRLRLLSNGMLALSFGRPGPVVLTVSSDGKGFSWSKPVEIFRGMSTRYTDFVEIAPGKLLMVYDSIPYGWNAIPKAERSLKNKVYGKFIEIRKG